MYNTKYKYSLYCIQEQNTKQWYSNDVSHAEYGDFISHFVINEIGDFVWLYIRVSC